MLTPEQLTIINGMVGRFNVTKFTSPKQMQEFVKAFQKQAEVKIKSALVARQAKADLRRAEAKRKDAFRAQVRSAWVARNLKVDEQVKGHFGTGVHTVHSVDPEFLALVTKKGAMRTEVELGSVTKVFRDGEWLDIYKVASGGM